MQRTGTTKAAQIRGITKRVIPTSKTACVRAQFISASAREKCQEFSLTRERNQGIPELPELAAGDKTIVAGKHRRKAPCCQSYHFPAIHPNLQQRGATGVAAVGRASNQNTRRSFDVRILILFEFARSSVSILPTFRRSCHFSRSFRKVLVGKFDFSVPGDNGSVSPADVGRLKIIDCKTPRISLSS